MESADVVVIGGGQAGLSISHELTQAGLEHVVLERDRVGSAWRSRWDSFSLVTPNWSVMLPGQHYDGTDPNGYMHRDEVVAFLERYAGGFHAPVREGVEVTSLESAQDGFVLDTSAGEMRPRTVVICTGAYQRPHRPPGAASLPDDVTALDVEEYTGPAALPPGQILVVGSGQTGTQLTEELHEAGRQVFLSCGRAPWAPRRLGDRDMFWWAAQTGFLDQPVQALPAPGARLGANVLGTGHAGGHDLHLRTLRALGVTLLGHFEGVDDHTARFAQDLAETVAWGDERYQQLMGLIRKVVGERGLPAPEIAEPEPFDGRSPETVDLSGNGAVIFAGGFRPDYGGWVKIPGAFDEMGFPVQVDGASAAAPRLYFLGVHFLRTRKSSLLCGVGEDATIVARQIVAAG
jgi:putative flavoprotein involved in K+ transport